MHINPRRSTKLPDRFVMDGTVRCGPNALAPGVNAHENIDTSEQTRALGQPRERAASCDARQGRKDARRQWSCGCQATMDNTKARP